MWRLRRRALPRKCASPCAIRNGSSQNSFSACLPTCFAARTPAWVPTGIKQSVLKMLLRVLQGPYSRYGLPENVRPPLSHHPTLNSDLLEFIRHGRINPRPAVKQLLGDKVEFVNDEQEPFDIICVCTGFWTTFPFFDKSFIDFQHVDKVPP